MSDILEEMCKEAREEGIGLGIKQGIKQGIEQGIEQGKVNSVRTLMKTMNWSADQAMKALQIPEKQQSVYRKIL